MTNVPAPRDPGAPSEPAASDSDLTPYEDRLFARILLEWQLVRSEQLNAGLHAQAEARARGKHGPLGEFMVDLGSITVGDVFRVLKEQNRRAESVPDVPRYEIRDRIGEGASSVVYRAWDRDLRRSVADQARSDEGRSALDGHDRAVILRRCAGRGRNTEEGSGARRKRRDGADRPRATCRRLGCCRRGRHASARVDNAAGVACRL